MPIQSIHIWSYHLSKSIPCYGIMTKSKQTNPSNLTYNNLKLFSNYFQSNTRVISASIDLEMKYLVRFSCHWPTWATQSSQSIPLEVFINSISLAEIATCKVLHINPKMFTHQRLPLLKIFFTWKCHLPIVTSRVFTEKSSFCFVSTTSVPDDCITKNESLVMCRECLTLPMILSLSVPLTMCPDNELFLLPKKDSRLSNAFPDWAQNELQCRLCAHLLVFYGVSSLFRLLMCSCWWSQTEKMCTAQESNREMRPKWVK